MSRIPSEMLKFSESGIQIGEIILSTHGYTADDYPWAKRMLGKYPIPQWQRDSVWTLEQKVSFIRSAYFGFDLGSVVFNSWRENSDKKLVYLSDIIIDGQQRIEAILDYVQDKFPVFGLYWSELTRGEQLRFKTRQLSRKTTRCFDEALLKEVYNHLNFSGTNHKESERAA